MSEERVDVVVVGAGPVGLVLAAELALTGAKVQVLERRTEPDEAVKAGAINVPTAEALDRRGLLPAAERVQRELAGTLANLAGGARFTGHFAGVVLDGDLVDWADPDLAAHTAVDAARLVPQRELEALLAEHVERLGVPLRRGVEVTSLADTGDSVVVDTTAGPLRASWLVGCDGGHSTVRRLAGIEFPGTAPELTGRLAVADIADPKKLAKGWVWSAGGAYRCGPQPGRLTTVEFDGGPTDRSAPVTLEEVQASLRRVSGTDVTLTALRGTATRWSDNTRQAAAYRSGRVLLAGDAAHVHPPFGGQGLNLGVGDATNLGWKLGAVIAGWAPAGLLDTYDTERRPLGAWVLDWTRAQIGILRGDPQSAALRAVVTALLATPDGATYALKQISGVTHHFPLPGTHPLVGCYAPDVSLADGSRLADHTHTGGFALLDRTPDTAFGRVASAWPTRVTTIADKPGDPGTPTGLLVRPDGVVAWATDTPDARDNADAADAAELASTLHRWAGAPAFEPTH
ncbi:FAD-dependent monooxygenase [Amycolatopsis rhabdoformis]|uniref:FAD-dependent monooxygenase n=1 Tax=Amycolatopsis rhabdoformis TaxID=1448059 RepID=A0ABZ1HXR1_9PSEU|nr:FAD-dependent monooxygenase [Amycolatopsis rhabdoformis]WSE26954.1 FAD-dependent monooxygenase [Amycolatopsis rhabdoformis]